MAAVNEDILRNVANAVEKQFQPDLSHHLRQVSNQVCSKNLAQRSGFLFLFFLDMSPSRKSSLFLVVFASDRHFHP
jgi:hypothetical protein